MRERKKTRITKERRKKTAFFLFPAFYFVYDPVTRKITRPIYLIGIGSTTNERYESYFILSSRSSGVAVNET